MSDVRTLLKKRPLLFDGGMGTYYKGAPGRECEQANRLDPEGIRAVHRAYLAAGADAIKTNTFGLPRMAAAQDPEWEALAGAGWKLAAEAAAGTDAAVFADLGPAPDTEGLSAAQVYTAVVRRFAALGAKNYLFETLSSDTGVLDAVRALRETVPDAFVQVSFAVLPDGYTREGQHCRALVRCMADSGLVDAVGLNCVSAPGAMRTLVQQLGQVGIPLSVMPNAGYPVVTRTQVQYRGKPDYFASELARLAAEGVRILGGCCGTTPAHIAALRKALDALPEGLPIVPAAQISTVSRPEVETDDAFLRKLRSGKKVIAVELDSPKDADLTAYLEGARRLQAAGTDLMTVADCPIARARMDSSLVACRVHRELGLPTLPHMTCRDRNLNATKALLLGLYAEGVREVLAITGDPIPSAERDEVKSVYQFNSRKLAQYIVSLAGEGREMPSPLTVFGALNLNARNFDVELRRAVEKLENGMTGFLTQPVLSEQAVQNLQQARQTLGPEAKILAGILPVVSQRNAIFMENEVNGIHVDQYIVSLAGEGREMPSPLTVFGALNLNARNFDVELRRAVEKLENGMTGFLTQPVLSEQAVQNLQQARQTLGPEAKILAGILPVVSQRNAIFMENEVNGIHVDAAIIDRFAGLDRAAGEELGIEISVQAAKAALPYADGFYLMTPFNRVALMERLIARLKEEAIKD